MRLSVLVAAIPLALSLASFGRASEKDTCADAAEQSQRLRAAKKFRAARAQMVTCSRPVCPAVIRDDCAKWLRDLDASFPTVVVRARDEQDKDVIAVKVTVDGEPLVDSLDGTAQAVEPGAHRFRYEATGMEPREDQVLIAEGEKGRVLSIQLKSLGKASTVVAPTKPVAGASSGPGVGPWIVTGIGIAGLVTFGVLETVGQIGYANLRDGCAVTSSCSSDDVSSVRLQLQLALVALGVGVVCVGVGITWLVLGSKKPARDVASHIDFTPLPGGAFGGFRTTF